MEIKIRKMTLEDVPAIYKMGIEAPEFRVSSEASAFWSQEELENWVKADQDVLLVTEVDGEIAGFVLTTFHRPTGKVTWENQFVLPKFRGRGVAKALTGEMLTQLKQKGATYVFFASKPGNESFEHYNKIGFNRGEDFVWFDLNL